MWVSTFFVCNSLYTLLVVQPAFTLCLKRPHPFLSKSTVYCIVLWDVFITCIISMNLFVFFPLGPISWKCQQWPKCKGLVWGLHPLIVLTGLASKGSMKRFAKTRVHNVLHWIKTYSVLNLILPSSRLIWVFNAASILPCLGMFVYKMHPW